MLAEAIQAGELLVFSSISLQSNVRIKSNNRNQFLQSLVNRMTQRLCSPEGVNATIMEDLKILDTSTWPARPPIRYGDAEILRLAKPRGISAL